MVNSFWTLRLPVLTRVSSSPALLLNHQVRGSSLKRSCEACIRLWQRWDQLISCSLQESNDGQMRRCPSLNWAIHCVWIHWQGSLRGVDEQLCLKHHCEISIVALSIVHFVRYEASLTFWESVIPTSMCRSLLESGMKIWRTRKGWIRPSVSFISSLGSCNLAWPSNVYM